MKNRLWLTSSAVTLALLSACGGDEPEEALPVPGPDAASGDGGGGGPTDPHMIPLDANDGARMCAEMGSYCHASDTGEANLGNTCHDVGHEGDPAACAEIYDECMAFCLSDAGHEEDGGGHHDAGEDHHDASALCEELGSTCHDTPGLGQYCHEVGHAGDAAACAAISDDCLALCAAGHDGGAHSEGDAGHTDAGGQLCETLGSACHDAVAGLALHCHDVGHDGDVAACSKVYDQCLKVCPHVEHDAGDGG